MLSGFCSSQSRHKFVRSLTLVKGEFTEAAFKTHPENFLKLSQKIVSTANCTGSKLPDQKESATLLVICSLRSIFRTKNFTLQSSF